MSLSCKSNMCVCIHLLDSFVEVLPASGTDSGVMFLGSIYIGMNKHSHSCQCMSSLSAYFLSVEEWLCWQLLHTLQMPSFTDVWRACLDVKIFLIRTGRWMPTPLPTPSWRNWLLLRMSLVIFLYGDTVWPFIFICPKILHPSISMVHPGGQRLFWGSWWTGWEVTASAVIGGSMSLDGEEGDWFSNDGDGHCFSNVNDGDASSTWASSALSEFELALPSSSVAHESCGCIAVCTYIGTCMHCHCMQ